jgi:hypothetical protein
MRLLTNCRSKSFGSTKCTNVVVHNLSILGEVFLKRLKIILMENSKRIHDSTKVEMGEVRQVLRPTIEVLCDEIKRLTEENKNLRLQVKELKEWHDSHI